jgi:hypothetical protein
MKITKKDIFYGFPIVVFVLGLISTMLFLLVYIFLRSPSFGLFTLGGCGFSYWITKAVAYFIRRGE